MKFKVGDKVKILWGKTPYLFEHYADKGEIVGGFGGSYEVRGFYEENPLYALIFKEDELILLEEEKPTIKVH